MNVDKTQKTLINILLIILPYHYLVFSILLSKFSFLTVYRDIIILVILVLDLYKTRLKEKKFDLFLLMLILILFIYACESDIFPNSFTILRVYIAPIALLFSCSHMEYNDVDLKKILKICVINGIIISIYGIFQAYILGANYLIKLGYPTNWYGGTLSASLYLSNYGSSSIGRGIQRVISTFSAANMCCFYLSCILIFVTQLYRLKKDWIETKIYNFFVIIVSLAIILTFSRSCWLGLIVFILYIISKLKKVKRNHIIYVLVASVVFLFLLVFAGNVRIVQGIIHIIESSFSGKDTSVLSHASTIENAIEIIKSNFWGLGLGKSGPRAINYGFNNLVESSYLLMCFELGIPGSVLYFLMYILLLIKKNTNVITRLLLLFVMIGFFNIPYIQEYECMAIFVILCCVSNNMKRMDIKCSEEVIKQ